MQFIKNGPNLPEALLQAHEDGRVVFFCGAGISYPAHLPGFGGLVAKLHEEVGEGPDRLETLATKAGQFDTAIGLLESRIADGRRRVRQALAHILTPNLQAPNATATHEALLTLSKTRVGATRLITTNFDRLFETVIEKKALEVHRYQAPLLPVPKNRWDGLVYLHGLLPPVVQSSTQLEHLVLSSGDFGLAYLSERWAARFVSELFRNYTVCFVGYSINDPVLRYMMDALAADRLLGESPPEMYAFGSYSKNSRSESEDEWRAKNVTPILYRMQSSHSYLHRTLRAWADIYRDGVGGKERIVVEYALTRPQASTVEDNFVGRMLWALSDLNGLPAKRFASDPALDRVPLFDWLKELSDPRLGRSDLIRFEVPPIRRLGYDAAFSLMRRPVSYRHGLPMTVASGAKAGVQWDEVMGHLARWLTWHLNNPDLLLWIANAGSDLHEQFAWLIDRALSEIVKLERDGDNDRLNRIRHNAPDAIPRPAMRTLWRLLLAGLIRSPGHGSGLYGWIGRLSQDGLSASLRSELRALLTPRITIREPFRYRGDDGEEADEDRNAEMPERVSSLVGWDLVLSTEHVHAATQDWPSRTEWREALPALLDDFNALLACAFDLLAELGAATSKSDGSYVQQPSISPHPQNRDFRDWTALIELTRDAWLAASNTDAQHARRVAEGWAIGAYPVFRRLAMFAATYEAVVPTSLGLAWLLDEDGWWMWTNETQRETMRLLVSLGSRLDEAQRATLERVILRGPPRQMYSDALEPERWNQIVDREIFALLDKLDESGAALSAEARAAFDRFRPQFGGHEREGLQADEFPVWMGEGEDWRTFVEMPRRPSAVIAWIRQHPGDNDREDDDWAEYCKSKVRSAAIVLMRLSQQDDWPPVRWRQALQGWSAEALRKRSWAYVGVLLAGAPDALIREIDGALSWWLEAVAKDIDVHEDAFVRLCQRLLAIEYLSGEHSGDAVARAINHPVGHATQALLNWWLQADLKDGDGLPAELSNILTQLCNAEIDRYRHARVILATYAIVLFRVDPAWTEEHLLDWFAWGDDRPEAQAIWRGFLGSPRIHVAFLLAIKSALLDTSFHYDDLGRYGEQYAAFMTYVALNRAEGFSRDELRGVLRNLPPRGLADSAQALARAQEGAGDRREEYWTNRIAPFWRDIWPKARDRATDLIAEALARLCIAAGREFPAALEAVRPWLRRLDHSNYVVHRLKLAGLCANFPQASLELLDAVVNRDGWPIDELGECLDAVRRAAPALANDPRFMDLRIFMRRRG